MSTYGPLYRFLARHSRSLVASEYFDDVSPGTERNGALCQDVQSLTFANACFDLVTCTEVFEHVPNDRQGFNEVHRTLRPGGYFIFMVPFSATPTVERARWNGGELVHMLEPEYHYDPTRAEGCLCFRNYGPDIVDRLLTSGFAAADIIEATDVTGWGFKRYVIVARKSPVEKQSG